MMNKKQNIWIVIILLLCVGLTALIWNYGKYTSQNPAETDQTDQKQNVEKKDDSQQPQKKAVIVAEGNTLETRVLPPEGYQRTSAGKNSLTSFLRKYKLKKAGSPVLYYNGRKKPNQNVHVAVFKLPLENEDLQQCADSIMRVYGEYYWHSGQPDKIAFHFVNGFLAEYSKWRQGYRIQISGDDCSWVKSAEADNSYETFRQYMRVVYSYASTLSMEAESEKIELPAIKTGDIFIKGGSPGHVVMVVDVCKNENGRKAFLLAQGYMPAQEFHLLKNPLHEDDPWYYEDEVTYPLDTAEYTFEKGSLRRPQY